MRVAPHDDECDPGVSGTIEYTVYKVRYFREKIFVSKNSRYSTKKKNKNTFFLRFFLFNENLCKKFSLEYREFLF